MIDVRVIKNERKMKEVLNLMPREWTSSAKLKSLFQDKKISSATLFRSLPPLIDDGLVEDDRKERGKGLGGTRVFYRRTPLAEAIMQFREKRFSNTSLDTLRDALLPRFNSRDKAEIEISILTDYLASAILFKISFLMNKGIQPSTLDPQEIVDLWLQERIRELFKICYRYRQIKPLLQIPVTELLADGYSTSGQTNVEEYLKNYCPGWAREYKRYVLNDILARILINTGGERKEAVNEIMEFLKEMEKARLTPNSSSQKVK